jgi:hypothetical protein
MSEGKKNDGLDGKASMKTRFDLIPPESEEQVAKVVTHGAEKYGEKNWQSLDNPHTRYTAAALRHLNAYRKGEKIDPESGLPHLAHVATNALFLLWFDKDSNGK